MRVIRHLKVKSCGLKSYSETHLLAALKQQNKFSTYYGTGRFVTILSYYRAGWLEWSRFELLYG
jgi:hypothetical protein